MTSTPFDTFSAARALETAGVERPQAEAIASAIGQTGGYATKTDISMLKTDVSMLKADLSTLESRMEARFSSLEARMYRALWIQGGAIVAILAALKLLA